MIFIDVNTAQGKETTGLAAHEVASVGEGNTLIAKTWGKSQVESQRIIAGWYAISVPGTILCPWDSDFTQIYATQNETALRKILEAIEKHNEGAISVLSLLSRQDRTCPETGIDVSQCCACSNGDH